MEITETLYVKNRDEWRSWLEENHDTTKEIWLIYFKKHTGKQRIPYDDAVEEALCFGWIDSTIKRVDEEIFVQRFTPRNKGSEWSSHNLRRVKAMINRERMTEAGLSKIDLKLLKKPVLAVKKQAAGKLVVPKYFSDALDSSSEAKRNFFNLAPSYKRYYIEWITAARKEETRIRRMGKAIALLEQNKKLPMM